MEAFNVFFSGLENHEVEQILVQFWKLCAKPLQFLWAEISRLEVLQCVKVFNQSAGKKFINMTVPLQHRRHVCSNCIVISVAWDSSLWTHSLQLISTCLQISQFLAAFALYFVSSPSLQIFSSRTSSEEHTFHRNLPLLLRQPHLSYYQHKSNPANFSSLASKYLSSAGMNSFSVQLKIQFFLAFYRHVHCAVDTHVLDNRTYCTNFDQNMFMKLSTFLLRPIQSAEI